MKTTRIKYDGNTYDVICYSKREYYFLCYFKTKENSIDTLYVYDEEFIHNITEDINMPIIKQMTNIVNGEEKFYDVIAHGGKFIIIIGMNLFGQVGYRSILLHTKNMVIKEIYTNDNLKFIDEL